MRRPTFPLWKVLLILAMVLFWLIVRTDVLRQRPAIEPVKPQPQVEQEAPKDPPNAPAPQAPAR